MEGAPEGRSFMPFLARRVRSREEARWRPLVACRAKPEGRPRGPRNGLWHASRQATSSTTSLAPADSGSGAPLRGANRLDTEVCPGANSNGCGSSIDFGRVGAQDGADIRYVGIWVCRDEITDACTHKNFSNPYA